MTGQKHERLKSFLLLAQLKTQELNIRKSLQLPRSNLERRLLEMDLQNVQASIAQMEATLKVSYKDYLQTLSGERKKFEKEKEDLRKRLAEAENRRLIAVDALKQQQHDGAKLASLEMELQKSIDARNKIAQEYATLTEAFFQQDKMMQEHMIHFENEQGKMQQTLDTAKGKHSQAIDALAAAATDGFEPVRVPEQTTIDELRHNLRKFKSTNDRKELINGLLKTRTELEQLLQKLYKEGRFTTTTARKDMEEALSTMEFNTYHTRQEYHKKRMELLENMKNQDLTSYDEEVIESLKVTNEAVGASDMFQKEIARRSAILKGILQLSDLLKECSEAIRDANERNLANMWADAIQEAKDFNLAKVWTEAIQDVKDSELAKAWANTIEGVKNSKLGQVWTDAIQKARNANLSKMWNDAMEDIKNSPLAKMWSDAVENTKNSEFGKFCAKSFQDAKNTITKILQ